MLNRISDGKIGWYLTVKQRIVYEGAVYHITQRAPGREIIFLEDSDYLNFLKLLKKVATGFQLELYAFVLMPNHVHLFLKINQTNLSFAMKSLFEKYAKYYNKKYFRKGHVFCGRFRASLCNDEQYFLAISVYIHLNPFKAGLCKSPNEYKWSSISLYVDNPKKSFVRYEKVLSMLDVDIEKARKQYWKILTGSLPVKNSFVYDPAHIKRGIVECGDLIKKNLGQGLEEDGNLDLLIEKFKEQKRSMSKQDQETRKYVVDQLLASGHSLSEINIILDISCTTLYRIRNFGIKS